MTPAYKYQFISIERLEKKHEKKHETGDWLWLNGRMTRTKGTVFK